MSGDYNPNCFCDMHGAYLTSDGCPACLEVFKKMFPDFNPAPHVCFECGQPIDKYNSKYNLNKRDFYDRR